MNVQPASETEGAPHAAIEKAVEQADPFVIEEIDVELAEDLISMRC